MNPGTANFISTSALCQIDVVAFARSIYNRLPSLLDIELRTFIHRDFRWRKADPVLTMTASANGDDYDDEASLQTLTPATMLIVDR